MKKLSLLILIFFININSNLFANSEQIELDLLDSKKIKLFIYIYKTEKTPAPTVIILHGCSGINSDHHTWAKSINSWGYNSVILDSFSGIISENICKTPGSYQPSLRAIQTYSLADWIEKKEWSEKKISVVGFSHGGRSVINIVTKELRSLFPNNKIASAVAFYPKCDDSIISRNKKDIPMQIHIGELDDWSPAFLCRKAAKKWDLKNNVYIYKGAYHSFDRLNVNHTYLQYVIKSDSDARELSMKRTKEFFDRTLR
jgi:dienelactone hydrolase